MSDTDREILEAISEALDVVVKRRYRRIIHERDAFEWELAKRFVSEGCDFVKGPYRMAHPEQAIPSNEALATAKRLLKE